MNEKAAGPILCFGEVLLRLSAARGERLMNAASLSLHPGGAEANVGAMLAQLGHKAEMVTVLPASALGDWCGAELLRTGLQSSRSIHAEGRLGLYFMESDARGGGHIVYDREHSVFAEHADRIDWPARVSGARLLHLSGINLALGGKPARSAFDAVTAARAAGVAISFDVNHRASLWEGRTSQEFDRVREIAAMAEVLFASPADLSRLLGFTPGNRPEDRRRAAETAFERFDQAKIIACTLRWFEDDCQRLSVRLDRRDDGFETEKASLGPIIDRVGSGDAFAAGVLDGLVRKVPEQELALAGLAAAMMKHGMTGDRWIGTRADLERFDPFTAADVRR